MKTFAFMLLSLTVNNCHAFTPDLNGISLPEQLSIGDVGSIKSFNPASVSSPGAPPSFASAPTNLKLDLKPTEDSDDFDIGSIQLSGIPKDPWVDPFKKGVTTPVTKDAVGVSFELEKLTQSKLDQKDCLSNCMLNKKCAVAVFCTIPSNDDTEGLDALSDTGDAAFAFGGNKVPKLKTMSGSFIGYCHHFAKKSGTSLASIETKEWGTECKSVVYHPTCRKSGFGVPATWDEIKVAWIPEGVRATYKCKAPEKYKKKLITKPIEAICKADGSITTSNACETREKDEGGEYKKPTLDLSEMLAPGSKFTIDTGMPGSVPGVGGGINTDIDKTDTTGTNTGTGTTNVDTIGNGATNEVTIDNGATDVDTIGNGATNEVTIDTGDTNVDTIGNGATNEVTIDNGATNVDTIGNGATNEVTIDNGATNVDTIGNGAIDVDTIGNGAIDVGAIGTGATVEVIPDKEEQTTNTDKDKTNVGTGNIKDLNSKELTLNFENREDKLKIRDCPPFTLYVKNGTTAPKHHWVADNFCIFYEEDFLVNRPSSKPYVICAATDYNDKPSKGIKKITKEMPIPDKALEGSECQDLCSFFTGQLKGWFPNLVTEDDVATCYTYLSVIYYNLNFIDTWNSFHGTHFPAPVLTSATMI